MALRRIDPRRKPLLLSPRAFSSSNPPFPPPPPQPPASDSDAAAPPHNPGASPNPSFSLFRDIRERLQSSPSPSQPRRIPMNPLRPSSAPGGPPAKSLDEVRRALENFREKSGGGGGAPSLSAPGAAPSFQDLLKNSPTLGLNAGNKAPGFEAIRESLKLRPQPHQRQPFLSPTHSIFSKELDRTGKGEGADKDPGTLFTKSYTYEELGQRLGQLAAAKDGKEWFSLEELQGRIVKLVQMEKDERLGGSFSQLRASLMKINQQEKSARLGSISLLGTLGGPQMLDSMRLPPQEELLERYFHPDHMSSEEKMKLELQKVRDEFKMTENDCGSARVQIAQLTVKIKHLSSVLHKKDKHSRKGLQDMVQRRKKYLKYLRRTDWDSYTLVLSKLGLRDVPEYKAPDYKSQPTTKAKSKKSKNKRKRKVKA